MRLIFDRGTIVLEGAEQQAPPPAPLSGFLWDDRIKAYRAPAFRYQEIRAALSRGRAGLGDAVLSPQVPRFHSDKLPLRPYQEAALASWRLYDRRGIVCLPTGSGKTFVAIGAIASSGLSTLCLVPTRVLLEQWREELAKHLKVTIGVIGDGHHTILPVTVATFESAYRHMGRLGNRFDLLIVDEVHHFGQGIRDEALEMCTAGCRLGLTATPVRHEDQKLRIQELVGQTVYELSVTELRGKYLAPFELLSIQVDLSLEERKTYETEMEKFRNFYLPFLQSCPEAAWLDFVRLASRSVEGKMALAGWHAARRVVYYPRAKAEMLGALLDRHRENKLLVFTADTKTAYAISIRFLLMPITSDIKRKERDEVIARFRDGRLRGLVSCRVLNEGVDVPDAEIAIIVGGTQGEREHIQRIGRCLRPREGKKAIVYELIAKSTLEVRHWQRRTRTLAPRVTAEI